VVTFDLPFDLICIIKRGRQLIAESISASELAVLKRQGENLWVIAGSTESRVIGKGLQRAEALPRPV